MADITPNVLFPNLTVDVNGITIPYTDLDGLTQAEANPSTGDGREVARILVNSLMTRLLALPSVDRPTRLTFNKPNPQGVGLNQIRQVYNFAFDVSYDPTDVAMVSEA